MFNKKYLKFNANILKVKYYKCIIIFILLIIEIYKYSLNNKEIYYGYGIWIQKKDKEIYKYYITGSDPGVDFRSSIYVKENLEITILSNKEFGAYDITRYVEKNFLF